MFRLPKALETIVAGFAGNLAPITSSGSGDGKSEVEANLKYTALRLLSPGQPSAAETAVLMLLD